MQDSQNGTGKPLACINCGEPIRNQETAIYDGEDWFCGHRCLGNWAARQEGNVPA